MVLFINCAESVLYKLQIALFINCADSAVYKLQIVLCENCTGSALLTGVPGTEWPADYTEHTVLFMNHVDNTAYKLY